jgi:hypothetical protein
LFFLGGGGLLYNAEEYQHFTYSMVNITI